MSVDFNECEICKQSIYEEFCKERIISGDYLYVCDNCMDKMQVECFAEYDDNYEDYSDEIKEYIDEYGEYYEYTESGRQTEIERLDKKIGYLKTRRDSLMENKNGENK